MNDHLQRIQNDTINSAYVSFAKRYKPRNASLAQQHDINNNIAIQIQPPKRRVKPRYLTPTRNNQSFQNRIIALPIISSSPNSNYYVSNLFNPSNFIKQDSYFKDLNQKFDNLLCGTIRKFNLNQEQKLFNQSFTQEEQFQMIKIFKEKPPYQFSKKNKQRLYKNKDLDKDFAIHDISQYFYKIQD